MNSDLSALQRHSAYMLEMRRMMKEIALVMTIVTASTADMDEYTLSFWDGDEDSLRRRLAEALECKDAQASRS